MDAQQHAFPDSEFAHRYTAFGLNFASTIPFPELVPAQGAPDIRIQLGQVPHELRHPLKRGDRFQAAPGTYLLKLEHIAKFLVTDGAHVMVQPAPGASLEVVRLFFLGSVIGAILQQRQRLPLHGSAVEVNGAAALFLGPSTAGKSTIAAGLASRGYRILTDDIIAIVGDKAVWPLVAPGYPRIKVTGGTLRALGGAERVLQGASHAAADSVTPIAWGTDEHGLALGERYCAQPLPVGAIFSLDCEEGGQPRIEPLTGAQKLQVLMGNTFGVSYVEGLDWREAHFEQCVALAKRYAVKRIVRPFGVHLFDEVIDMAERALKAGQPARLAQ